MKNLALLLICILVTPVHAQINFKMGNTEVKQTSLKPDHVRHFMGNGDYKNARDIALQCFRESGDGWCEYYAGQITYEGPPGVDANQAEGLRMIQSAANKDVSSAQVMLGNLHFNGAGFPKNTGEAVKWWIRGAKNCNAWAQNMLARAFFDGEYVQKDFEESYYWIDLAAYYRFPGADKGVEVVGGQLSETSKRKIRERTDQFIKSSGCGASANKPVVHDEWG